MTWPRSGAAMVAIALAMNSGCAAVQATAPAPGEPLDAATVVGDSTAFALVVARVRSQIAGPLRVDPSPLGNEGWSSAQQRQADTSLRPARARHLSALGIPEDSVEQAGQCRLNGLETPAQRALVPERCSAITPYLGVEVGVPERSESNPAPGGLLGTVGPWRVRAYQYWVHPSERVSGAIFDYYLSLTERGWQIVGRATVLYGD
jgi:hypothetical protein